MRLKELSLIKYGKFTDQSLSLPQAPLDFHVIVGPNEAGKSTIRTAVSELLFGMKLQTPLDFLHSTPELRLGGVLQTAKGETAFHRARGRSSLRTASDDRLPDDHLAPLLEGATKEFFEQMHGLDHERLVEGGRSILNASDKLGQVLFESAAGVGSLGPVRDDLDARASELWAPRRNSCEYALAETAFTEATADLKSSQVRTRDWSDRKDELDSITEQIDQARDEQSRLETLRSKLERVRRMAPFLRTLTTHEAALAALGSVVELPTTASVELLKAQGDIAAEEKLLEARKGDWSDKRIERDQLEVDEAVLSMASDIESLDILRGACVNHPRDLPLRQAEYDRLMGSAINAAGQLGWPTDAEGLRSALPKALALKTVTNLLREHGGLDQAVASASETVQDRERELAELKASLHEIVPLMVPSTLPAALSAAQGYRNGDAKERGLERAVAAAQRDVTTALDALGTWRMPIDQLHALDLPSPERVATLQRDANEKATALAKARESVESAKNDLNRLALQERHFTENNKIITGMDVQAARASRDGAWADIKNGAVALEVGALAVDSGIRLADELVDSQLGTTQAAATLQALRQQIESATADLARKETLRLDCEAALAAFNESWERLTSSSGIPGMPLHDLGTWLTKRDAAFAMQRGLALRTEELDEARSARAAARAALLSALREASLGGEADDILALIGIAESHVQSADRAAAQLDGLTERVKVAERALGSAQSKATNAQKAYDRWKADWDRALKDANLASIASTLAAAEGAVDLANTVAADLSAAQDPYDRIQRMRADLDEMETVARRLAGVLQPDLLSIESASEIARQLVSRLSTSKEAENAIRRADEAVRQAQDKVAETEAAVAKAQARVEPLLQAAGVDSIKAALPIAELSDQRRALLREIEHVRDALLRDGDGLSQEAIAAEVAEFDILEVPALLERTKQDLESVRDTLTRRLQTQVIAEQAFTAVNGQGDAAVAEAKRYEALSAMGEVAEQYIEAATASRLLKWATDRYRDQKQGPMLKRAGEIFAGLTLGEFSRLTVDTERNPPALFAKRASGQSVEVIGLSEGTRDQLFLALRVAALEMQLEKKAPLPFVADDLFINFDDERAKAGLDALKHLSSKTQVLFLTHHEHLVPLVRDVFGQDVNIVRLERGMGQALG